MLQLHFRGFFHAKIHAKILTQRLYKGITLIELLQLDDFSSGCLVSDLQKMKYQIF